MGNAGCCVKSADEPYGAPGGDRTDTEGSVSTNDGGARKRISDNKAKVTNSMSEDNKLSDFN